MPDVLPAPVEHQATIHQSVEQMQDIVCEYTVCVISADIQCASTVRHTHRIHDLQCVSTVGLRPYMQDPQCMGTVRPYIHAGSTVRQYSTSIPPRIHSV
jgi:hypothetical protein